MMLFMAMSMIDSPKDKRKVEQLYEKYHKLMYVLAFNILKHREDAEDVAIEAWEKVIRHLDKIKEIDCQETKSFLAILVERTAIDYYRKNKKRGKMQALIDEYESSPFYATTDTQLQNIEIMEIFRNLPKIYSDILLLYYVNGFTGKEIAEMFGIKEDAVMKRLSRGRKMLRKEFGIDGR